MPRSRSIHLIRLGFVLLTTVVGLSLAAGEYWWVGALGGITSERYRSLVTRC